METKEGAWPKSADQGLRPIGVTLVTLAQQLPSLFCWFTAVRFTELWEHIGFLLSSSQEKPWGALEVKGAAYPGGVPHILGPPSSLVVFSEAWAYAHAHILVFGILLTHTPDALGPSPSRWSELAANFDQCLMEDDVARDVRLLILKYCASAISTTLQPAFKKGEEPHLCWSPVFSYNSVTYFQTITGICSWETWIQEIFGFR